MILAIAGAMTLAITSASAADLQRPVYKATPVVAAYNWSGFYLGGHIGYGWGDASATPTGIVGLLIGPFDGSHDGFLAGGTLGMNYQSGNIVLGLEGEWTWSNIDGSSTAMLVFGVPGAVGTYSNNWIATVAGRVGVAFDTVLVYGKAGIAWANNDYAVTTINFAPYASTISETETGWLVGLGVEWAFAPNWTMKIEGNYMDFGRTNHAFAPVGGFLPINSDIDSHIGTVKLGVNYRFGN
jgi:outer membrane immunogenic protein